MLILYGIYAHYCLYIQCYANAFPYKCAQPTGNILYDKWHAPASEGMYCIVYLDVDTEVNILWRKMQENPVHPRAMRIEKTFILGVAVGKRKDYTV